jgi:hypothetical protein
MAAKRSTLRGHVLRLAAPHDGYETDALVSMSYTQSAVLPEVLALAGMAWVRTAPAGNMQAVS